jgi:branched-chain amino acid transport system ATP-binding protein
MPPRSLSSGGGPKATAFDGRSRSQLASRRRLGPGSLAVQMILEIVEPVNRRGTTILLVEHNVRRALRLCHRGYVVENGAVALAGSREELLRSDHVRQAYLGM